MIKEMMKKQNTMFIARLFTVSLWVILIYLELTRHTIVQSSILIGTILLGPIYCGWFCPMGVLQNLSAKLGRILKFPKIQLPGHIHKYAKYLKFILWGFALLPFGIEIFGALGIEPRRTVNSFVISSEVISITAIIALIILLIISMFNERFYCKYLCTKGAEYSLLSSLRLFRIKRTSKCVGCNKCSKECPMQVDIMKNELVNDITCISCLDCVDSCKVKGSIEYKPIIKTLVERWKK